MHAYPHVYKTRASAASEGPVSVGGPGLPRIVTYPPPQFDGPEGHWSPETLLAASVADCFILSFRAVARASKFEWTRLDVCVQGRLERVDGLTRFTRFTIEPRLETADGVDHSRARAVLEKAKRTCLISNSLLAECELKLDEGQACVDTADAA